MSVARMRPPRYFAVLSSALSSDVGGTVFCNFFASLAIRILYFQCVEYQRLITPVGLSDLFLAESTRKVLACSSFVMLDQLAILDKVCCSEARILLVVRNLEQSTDADNAFHRP